MPKSGGANDPSNSFPTALWMWTLLQLPIIQKWEFQGPSNFNLSTFFCYHHYIVTELIMEFQALNNEISYPYVFSQTSHLFSLVFLLTDSINNCLWIIKWVKIIKRILANMGDEVLKNWEKMPRTVSLGIYPFTKDFTVWSANNFELSDQLNSVNQCKFSYSDSYWHHDI